ncbi:putative phosphatase [Bradyrhizobium sp. ORS 285]|uniref:HAD family hydrolase n=1 Tax=Bradyrhizobium sp. ORS 285 TaxID=115808 RepID=UPI00024083E9|nr:HAD family phosphatase [Bradyrhizobium sp. ORS 285]CCD85630.1 putative phosphatase [Bradyrhizobium sp. ORS 285]SMX58944.1 putative phosphatase [Bradyrhizobium sp. ORS 285]
MSTAAGRRSDGSSLTAYLFDLDGTLAASEALKARALAQACTSYGVEADPLIYADVMGQDWTTVTGHFFTRYGINPARDAFNARFRGIYLDLLEREVAATDGAVQFVRSARDRGMKVGLVSSAASWMAEKVLARLDLTGAFDIVITQEDVIRHKPDPEAYRLALSRLGVDATAVLVFEDSLAGLTAASSAGCGCIAIRHGFNTRHDFSAATREIRSFTELGLG